MDNLSLTRIWEDNDFFEIEFYAQSELISAKARSYVTEEAMHKLSAVLASFPLVQNDRFLWENGTKGDNSTPFISLEFQCEDKFGHILVEIYMEIDDGASLSVHNCCFFVRTNIGELNSFGNNLKKLCVKGIGAVVTLNQGSGD